MYLPPNLSSVRHDTNGRVRLRISFRSIDDGIFLKQTRR